MDPVITENILQQDHHQYSVATTSIIYYNTINFNSSTIISFYNNKSLCFKIPSYVQITQTKFRHVTLTYSIKHF